MRASNVVIHICATASFGFKMRIEKVGGNREGVAVSRQTTVFQLLREDEV